MKILKKLQKEEKHVDNEELIAAISQIAISGSVLHERRRSEIIKTVETLDQLTEALNGESYQEKGNEM